MASRIRIASLLALGLLAGCVSAPAGPPGVPTQVPGAAARPSHVAIPKGLEGVIGQDRAALIRRFGPPVADTVEVYGRKLQWSGRPCILDAYFYPEGRGGAEIATWVDARRSDGAAVDRALCVSALSRR